MRYIVTAELTHKQPKGERLISVPAFYVDAASDSEALEKSLDIVDPTHTLRDGLSMCCAQCD